MKSPQVDMLHSILDLLIEKENLSPADAFKHLLEIVANKLHFDDPVSTPWIKQTTIIQIESILDFDLLKESPDDWFGDLHYLLGLDVIGGGAYYVSPHEADQALSHIPLVNHIQPSRILDPVVGTGRNVLAMHRKYGTSTIFYGVEHDEYAYRIALINMKLHNVQSVILCADKTKHDIREHSPNWRFANKWNIMKRNRLLPVEEVDERSRKDTNDFYRFK